MTEKKRLKLYNTMTYQKEEFVPLIEEWKSEFVGIYSCGPTVYSSPTIGNYRAFFTADLIRNVLKYICEYPVKTVMNITDVGHLTDDGDAWEDKLEKGSKRDWISVWEVAKKYESEFFHGLKEMQIDSFDVMPKATDHILEQIEMIKRLEEKGYTYEISWDGIYMDTSKVEDYGKLMGPNYKKRLENLNAGERVDMGEKKHATDFALRKFSPSDEKRQMERDSPWWVGFPGWHIECSAMSSKYLGNQFDIHHGGADHITVHHPNEIAQSEVVFENQRVKYRVHNQFLQVDGGKMGKSLGNAYTLEDIKAKWYSPLDLRYFFFVAQYGSFQNFTRDALEQAKKSRENLKKKIQKSFQESTSWEDANFQDQIISAFLDNFNTPKVLSIIGEKKVFTSSELNYLTFLEKKVLKVWLFEEEKNEIEIPEEITNLANQRLTAKKEKDYALADELRNQIQNAGFEIKDIPEGFEIVKNKSDFK